MESASGVRGIAVALGFCRWAGPTTLAVRTN